MSTHITFLKLDSSTKTQRWQVTAIADFADLGEIRWFARWYQYSFFPAANTVFEKTCLRDIAAFCEDKTKEHKTGWKRRKTAAVS